MIIRINSYKKLNPNDERMQQESRNKARQQKEGKFVWCCLLMRFLVLLQELNINIVSIIKQASIIIYVLKTNEKHPIAFITITSNCVLKITIK